MPDGESKRALLDDRTPDPMPPSRVGGPQSPPRAAWAWLSMALLGVLAAGFVIAAGGPNAFIGPSSPSPSVLTAVAPTPTPTIAGLSPTPGSSACGLGRVKIQPVTSQTKLDSIGPIRMPAGGLLAMAVETTDTSGSIIVAQGGENGLAGSVHEVATFTGRDIHGPFDVTVVGWSAAGDQFLVSAAHQGIASGDPSCANLFMVHADGSGVRDLTNNGAGDSIAGTAFAARTGQVAFVQDDDLRVTDTDDPDKTGKVADCSSPWSIQWAPDERRVVAICARGQFLVVAGAGEQTRSFLIPNVLPVLAAWSPDSSSITLASAGAGDLKISPLTIFDVDPSTGNRATRVISDTPTEWAAPKFISPNGQWLLINGRLAVSKEFPSFVVDLTTGVTNRLPWPVFSGVVGHESFAWLPDGDSMLYGDNERLYVLNLRERTRTEVGFVPVPDFAWVNRTP